MNIKQTLLGALLMLGVAFAHANNSDENALWLRYPAISPDGSQIVFAYKGNLYKVSVSGGVATQLITNAAYDYRPVFSADGKTIAFSSNRTGNFDVFTMSIDGGTPKRVTYFSGGEIPLYFSRDGKTLYIATHEMKTKEY